MTSFPSLFLAHGAPDLPLTNHAAKRFLNCLSRNTPEPKAILIISAHWEARSPTFGTAARPKTIYDFGGFPAKLKDLVYSARTDKLLINRATELLKSAGIDTDKDPTQGYDHGVWIPLLLAYPDANIPVVQLSLQLGGDARHHFEIGRALAPLRSEGVLIIGSGSTVHNLGQMAPEGSAPPTWAEMFDDWVFDCVKNHKLSTLLAFPQEPFTASIAHPTLEHFLPIYVALGAGWDAEAAERIHHSYSYGSLGMACYAFGASTEIIPLKDAVGST